jgi:cytochrome bd-type quinol oxidase subunit 1
LASEAETIPLPSEEATPPVTKIYFVLRGEVAVFFEVSLVEFLVVFIACCKQINENKLTELIILIQICFCSRSFFKNCNRINYRSFFIF